MPKRIPEIGMIAAIKIIKLIIIASTGLPYKFSPWMIFRVFTFSGLSLILIRLWKTLINAGNNVKAASTANKTLIADANPITAKKSIPTNERPQTAIITEPANITALPAVPTAKAIDSTGVPFPNFFISK